MVLRYKHLPCSTKTMMPHLTNIPMICNKLKTIVEMRTLYRFFLLLAVGLLTALSGCGEDETPSLATYPDNNFSLVAEDGEGSEITVNATYNNEGILEFDKPVIFTFRFNASPEDAIVTFEPIGEDVELSDTKLIIPAGYTDASVTLGIKIWMFSI